MYICIMYVLGILIFKIDSFKKKYSKLMSATCVYIYKWHVQRFTYKLQGSRKNLVDGKG